MSDAANRDFPGGTGGSGGADDRVFLSESRGYVIVDRADGSVWECDFDGYRVTAVPDDAVELVPLVADNRDRLTAALATVRAAGFVVVKEKSYRGAQERLRRAESCQLWATEQMERAWVYARDCLTDERRLRERLTHVYGVAMRFGATHDDLIGPELPQGAPR